MQGEEPRGDPVAELGPGRSDGEPAGAEDRIGRAAGAGSPQLRPPHESLPHREKLRHDPLSLVRHDALRDGKLAALAPRCNRADDFPAPACYGTAMDRRRPIDRPYVQALVLAGAGALLGLTVNAARTDGLALDRPVLAASGAEGGATCSAPAGVHAAEIEVAEARALQAAGAAFVDARPAGDYAAGHVPNALHLPSRGECPDSAQVIAAAKQAGTVVVYDDGGSCELARHLGERLLAEGLGDVRVMLGGFPGWQHAGEPAQSGLCEACEHLAEGR